MIDATTIRALAYIAARCRPAHSPHAEWDERGIVACITKVAHLSLPEVAAAVIRAASDPTAKNPGLIADTTSSAWRERQAELTTRSNRPPMAEETCGQHGGWRENCPGCRSDELAEQAEARPKQPAINDNRATPEQVAEYAQRIRANLHTKES